MYQVLEVHVQVGGGTYHHQLPAVIYMYMYIVVTSRTPYGYSANVCRCGHRYIKQ